MLNACGKGELRKLARGVIFIKVKTCGSRVNHFLLIFIFLSIWRYNDIVKSSLSWLKPLARLFNWWFILRWHRLSGPPWVFPPLGAVNLCSLCKLLKKFYIKVIWGHLGSLIKKNVWHLTDGDYTRKSSPSSYWLDPFDTLKNILAPCQWAHSTARGLSLWIIHLVIYQFLVHPNSEINGSINFRYL